MRSKLRRILHISFKMYFNLSTNFTHIKIVKRCGSILQIARYFVFQIATDLETVYRKRESASPHVEKKCKSKSVYDQSTILQHYAKQGFAMNFPFHSKRSVENSRGRKIFRHPFGFNYTRYFYLEN